MINVMHMYGSISIPIYLDVSVWVLKAFWDMEKTPITKNLLSKTNFIDFNSLFNSIVNK